MRWRTRYWVHTAAAGVLMCLIALPACAEEPSAGGSSAERGAMSSEVAPPVLVEPAQPTAMPDTTATAKPEQPEPRPPTVSPADTLEPEPTEPSGQPEGDATSSAESTQAPQAGPENRESRVVYPYGTYLLVEIIEERVVKSDSGGQTTSFAGESSSYNFDPENGTLTGLVKGAFNEAALTIVGRLVVTQIDRSKAQVGQLYAITQPGQVFGSVRIDRTASDGTVFLVVGGVAYTLQPGETISLVDANRATDDRLAVGASSRSISVTNHGFLKRANLTIPQL